MSKKAASGLNKTEFDFEGEEKEKRFWAGLFDSVQTFEGCKIPICGKPGSLSNPPIPA